MSWLTTLLAATCCKRVHLEGSPDQGIAHEWNAAILRQALSKRLSLPDNPEFRGYSQDAPAASLLQASALPAFCSPP
jgi:hypothetical protein